MKITTSLLSYRDILIKSDGKLSDVSLFKNGVEIALNYQSEDAGSYYSKTEEDIELGNEYVLLINKTTRVHLNVTNAIHFDDFDMKYTYLANDLGAKYSKEETKFALWAPLCYRVYLHLVDSNKKIEMIRDNYGVYRVTIHGDLDGALYRYLVYVNDEVNEVTDPYAKSSNANNEASAVIDLTKLNDIKTNSEFLPPFKEYVESIIYELSVRDMTISKSTNIEHKGKYLGLTEENRTTKKGNPAGLDYLKYLGVTHVQLLPVLDFKTVDELNPDKTYNWGYDPAQLFGLEGSYSLNPNDPYSRMKEFKMLIGALHKVGIRVNLDVVYNHVYDVRTHALQKITPFYFFRHTKDYHFIEHSYCGDDFASERPMAKKMIVDSINFLMHTYDVDGFRFDLMGLIDVRTMKEVDRVARSVKPNVMLYGEGWDMFAATSNGTPLAHMNNAHILPNFAFFNDRFRNIIRGSGGSTPLDERGYGLGNSNYFDGAKFVILGSCLDVTFPHLFISANQSVNYVECHDNATLFDAIDTSTKDSDANKLERIKMINRMILHSFGIPFFHAGQEIGATKYGNGNTYNKGDKYNLFDYDLLDKHIALADDFRQVIALRRYNRVLKTYDPDELMKMVDFSRKNDCLIIDIKDPVLDREYKFFINPTEKALYSSFNEPAEQIIAIYGKEVKSFITDEAMIFPLTMQFYRRKK